MMLLAEARPTALVAIRQRQIRWHEVRALLRTLEQIVQANAYLDGGRALDDAQEVELAIADLVAQLDAEATRLSVEAMQLYVRTIARSSDRLIEMETTMERAHREAGSPDLTPPASAPKPRDRYALARAFVDQYPRGRRFKGPEYVAALREVLAAFNGNAMRAAAAIGRTPVSLYKFRQREAWREAKRS